MKLSFPKMLRPLARDRIVAPLDAWVGRARRRSSRRRTPEPNMQGSRGRIPAAAVFLSRGQSAAPFPPVIRKELSSRTQITTSGRYFSMYSLSFIPV